MTEILIDYQIDTAPKNTFFPSKKDAQKWFDTALSVLKIEEALELTLRFVDKAEITDLNSTYRNKDYATNVLSFPVEWNIPQTPRLLGDIVVAVEVVNQEAQVQNKTAEAHWAHMCIHGLLHLLGYDHIIEAEAEEMEAEERQILAALGFPDPYY